MPDDAAALPAHQLEGIRILLLRHQAAAGRRGVRELEEAELLRRKEDEVLRDSAQVDHPERGGVQEGRDEVAIAADVDAVARDAAETEGLGQGGHVNRITRARNCSGSERQLVRLVENGSQTVDVAAQRGAMRQQE